MRKSPLRFALPFGIVLLAAVPTLVSVVLALEGQVVIHDPSTIVLSDGKYYTYGTGGTALVSDDGWTWRRGVTPPRSGMAPDLIRLADRYCLYVATSLGQPKAVINMIWTRSLDPSSPDYKWEEGGLVASSDGVEDCNAIDPGVFRDPTDGRLWMVYGSYFGYIRLVELDPKTGKRLNPNVAPRNLAVNCEASDLIYHDGWYYLLATHGSCCRGADSGYNIRVGRSRKIGGPYLDNMGVDMIQGGGKLLIGSGGRVIGPGHFGLLDLGDGVQKFSLHWEADLDRGGASVVDIRPLLWRDGWPVAGENAKEGTYEIESVRTGTALELAVEGMPVGGRVTRGARGGPGGTAAEAGGTPAPRPGGTAAQAGGTPAPRAGEAPAPRAGGTAPQAGETPAPRAGEAPAPRPGGTAAPAGARGMFGGTGGVIPSQDVAQVSAAWPAQAIDVRMANYMCQAQQKWAITPAPDAGGYLGSPYFKITIAGTGRALAVSPEAELVVLPAFTGGPEQLWRIDQLADGTWRIMPKAVPGSKGDLALSAVGSSFATLAKFDPTSEKQRWLLKTP